MELESLSAETVSAKEPCSKSPGPQAIKLDMKPTGPGSIFRALCLDQASCSNRQLSFRESYLCQHLSTCDSMYSTDVRGHHGCVNALAFSRGEEQFLASGGDDHRVLVWRVADVVRGPKKMQPVCMNTRHTSNIFTLDFSCDNSHVFSGGEDSELIKHDFKTHQCVSTYNHLEAVYSVAAHPSSPEVVFTASEDGCVYIIDTRLSRRELGQDMLLCEALESFQCVAINPVEPVLVAVSNTHRGSALYDTRNKKKVISYKSSIDTPVLRENGVSVSFSSSGSQIFSMYRHHPPTLHTLWEHNPLCYFSDSQGAYRNTVTMKSGCFMGQDDEFVVSGSDDFRVYIWKVPSAAEIAAAKEGSSAVASSSLSWCGMQQNTPHLVLPGHRSIVNQTQYSKVHRVLVSSGVEKVVKVWSDMPLNANHTLQRSRDLPARKKFTGPEIHSIMAGLSSHEEPSDPSDEDIKVLALFDSLVEDDLHDGDYIDSDDNLSVSSELFFPFWRDLPFFFGDDSDDSSHSDFSANPSSIEPPWSDEEESDLDEYEEPSDWDCSCDEEEEQEEDDDVEDNERGGRNDVIDRILQHVDEELLGLRRQRRESRNENDTASAPPPSRGNGENSQDREGGRGRSRKRMSGNDNRENETKNSTTGGATGEGSSAAMCSRHTDVPDGSTTHSEDGVFGESSGPGDGSEVQLNGAASPAEDDGASDGYPRTRSKRKKLLDLRARCSTGGGSAAFGDSYAAEDFLRSKPPSNFYASSSSGSKAGNSSK